MKQWQVLRTVFPEVITDNFEFTDYVEQADRLEYWLDEREYMSREDYKKGVSPKSRLHFSLPISILCAQFR